MTTLIADSPVAALLDRLFAEADSATSPEVTRMSREERERLMHSKTEYLQFHRPGLSSQGSRARERVSVAAVWRRSGTFDAGRLKRAR